MPSLQTLKLETIYKGAKSFPSNSLSTTTNIQKLVIPGKASRVSGEIEELSGWKVLVGPRDSSEIPKYIIDKWQP